MALFAVTYTYADNSTEARNEHRPAHRAFIQEAFAAKKVRLSGPAGDDSALIIVEGETEADVASLFDADPFALRGLIANRDIRPWTLFFGHIAE
ncbi:MAG: hypothetical protein JWP30_594 [Homoserinimonas sp.]|jgi:uncharacterized protein YciI|nr:hypothetical protein [Homoserinimonas sp.]